VKSYFGLTNSLSIVIPAFAQFAPENSADPRAFSTLILPKLAYILCNILTLVVGAWKCNQMGLLPVGTGDWLAFEQRANVSRTTTRIPIR
jgi:hypothetical protein